MICNYEDAIDNIVAHLKIEHNIDVEFADDELGAYYHDAGIVGINTGEPLQHQLYILLHEAGHANIRHEKRKLSVLAEEEAAWREGRHLAQKLKIEINQSSWAPFCEKHLNDYRKWVMSA